MLNVYKASYIIMANNYYNKIQSLQCIHRKFKLYPKQSKNLVVIFYIHMHCICTLCMYEH